jgi:hypothetical protein
MALGTAAGLVAYSVIGFYVAALVSATVSMVVVLIASRLWPDDFDWRRLATEQPAERAASLGGMVAPADEGVAS